MTIPAITKEAKLVNDFQNSINDEFRNYEKLYTDLYNSKSNIESVEKNWKELNGDFFKRLKEEPKILQLAKDVNDQIKASALTPNDKKSYTKTVELLTKDFEGYAPKKRTAILERMIDASKTIGIEKCPIEIKEFKKVPTTSPSLLSRFLSKISGMIFNKTSAKVAGVSAVILATQVGVPVDKIISNTAQLAGIFTWNFTTNLLSRVSALAIENPSTATLVTAICTVPSTVSAWHSGNKKKALGLAVLGIAGGVIPHAFAAAAPVRTYYR